jgi:putative serine/threonine protein kinase
LKKYKNNPYKKIRLVSKGWSGLIWLVENNSKKNFVKKEMREKSNRPDLALREGTKLKLANKFGIGPKLKEINFEKNFVIMEYINGEKLLDFVQSKSFDKLEKKELYEFIKELLRQCLILDSNGLIHTQLQVGKNILVTKKQGKIFPIIKYKKRNKKQK